MAGYVEGGEEVSAPQWQINKAHLDNAYRHVEEAIGQAQRIEIDGDQWMKKELLAVLNRTINLINEMTDKAIEAGRAK